MDHDSEFESKTYSIPVSGELDSEVKVRMETGGFGSLSEYVRSTIRADLERSRHEVLEKKLLRAIERGDFKEVTPQFFDDLRALARGDGSDESST